MKNIRRAFALLLTICLLFTAVGCKRLAPAQESEPTPITMDIADGGSGESAQTAEPAPEATATPDPAAISDFQTLDLEIFRWYATQDGYSFHQLVSDPTTFGIDRNTVVMTLGEFTEAATDTYAAQAAAFLERLALIPRARLNENEQLSYDIIEQYLEDVVAGAEYDYYYEPLTQYSGLHANLPLMFALFNIESERDANDYLLLLADVPRYLDQVLAYEQERAKLGIFMTEDALDAVLEGCKSIIDSRDSSALYGTFNAAVDALDSVAGDRAESLKLRNATLVRNDFIDAYRKLYNGLSELRSKCRKTAGAYTQGGKALEYYEKEFQGNADNKLSVEESLELLQEEMTYLLLQYFEISEAYPDALTAEKGPISSGNTDQDLAMLKELTARILPALPEHTLEVSDVPEEWEKILSPAMYVIPSMDGWKHNQVLINTGSVDDAPLFKLAHEAYPGHLYQYVYQRGLTQLGYMQRALHYGAYSEAWSQLGEYQFIKNQTQYDQNYCLLKFYNEIVVGTLLPCVVSIWVNYQGYTREAIQLKLDALFGDQSESLANSFYELAVDQPYYFVYYAMGFCQLMKMLRDAEADIGDGFDQKAYLAAYLNLGPGYFNIIQERMDVWVDERVLEVLGE